MDNTEYEVSQVTTLHFFTQDQPSPLLNKCYVTNFKYSYLESIEQKNFRIHLVQHTT